MALSPEAHVARQALLRAVKLRTGLTDAEAETILRRTAYRMAGHTHEQAVEKFPLPKEGPEVQEVPDDSIPSG